jgi:eukaryotic-like serine/threonine-protein kinase
MSPEQAQGKVSEIGPHSDQYSLGAVFYELLTGQKPFDGPPSVAIAKAATMEPTSPRKLIPIYRSILKPFV